MRRVTGLSSFCNCRLAESVYSIVQAKIGSHLCAGMNLFHAFADSFQDVRSEIVIFQVIQTVFDNLTKVKGLGSAVCAPNWIILTVEQR
jgi:hypothetical protein